MISVIAVCDACLTEKEYDSNLGSSVAGAVKGDYSEVRGKVLCLECKARYEQQVAAVRTRQRVELEKVLEDVVRVGR